MVDWLSFSLAVGAFATAVVGIVGYLLQREQVEQLERQLSVESRKAERLGDLVNVLREFVETQKSQLETVQAQVKLMSDQLKLKHDELLAQQQSNQLRQQEIAIQTAQLEWQKADPVTKVKTWIGRALRRRSG